VGAGLRCGKVTEIIKEQRHFFIPAFAKKIGFNGRKFYGAVLLRFNRYATNGSQFSGPFSVTL
jgi:hypothetical protein